MFIHSSDTFQFVGSFCVDHTHAHRSTGQEYVGMGSLPSAHSKAKEIVQSLRSNFEEESQRQDVFNALVGDQRERLGRLLQQWCSRVIGNGGEYMFGVTVDFDSNKDSSVSEIDSTVVSAKAGQSDSEATGEHLMHMHALVLRAHWVFHCSS